MRTSLLKGLFVSLLFALTFSFAACDSGGSNNQQSNDDSTPVWVGKWDAEKLGLDAQARLPDNDVFWDITGEGAGAEFNIIEVPVDSSEASSVECPLIEGTIIESNEESIRFRYTKPNVTSVEVELKVSGSEETLNVSVSETDPPVYPRRDTITVEPIDFNPRDRCDEFTESFSD